MNSEVTSLKHSDAMPTSERVRTHGSSLTDIIKRYEESSSNCNISLADTRADKSKQTQLDSQVTQVTHSSPPLPSGTCVGSLPCNSSTSTSLSNSPPPPLPPDPTAKQSAFLGPEEVDASKLTEAINSIHGMFTPFQAQISANLEEKFSSLETQIVKLHDKFAKQDTSFQEMVKGMVSKIRNF